MKQDDAIIPDKSPVMLNQDYSKETVDAQPLFLDLKTGFETGEISLDALSAADKTKIVTELVLGPIPLLPYDANPGKEIPYGLAEKCIFHYIGVMSQHGFTYPTRPINITLLNSSPITYSENFDGRAALDWWKHQIETLQKDNKDAQVLTRLAFGMYTEEVLADDVLKLSQAEREYKLGRTTIFIIPYIVSEGKFIVPPPVVYDFGGLQP
jgi:hypothetical protein